jgi:hypothetical protein
MTYQFAFSQRDSSYRVFMETSAGGDSFCSANELKENIEKCIKTLIER